MFNQTLLQKIRTSKPACSSQEELLFRAYEIALRDYQNENFDIKNFAIQLAVSRQHLHRVMQAALNLSPTGFVRRLRLEKAAEMLESGTANVTETCFQVGFNHLSYFSRCFQEVFKLTPSAYINLHTIAKA